MRTIILVTLSIIFSTSCEKTIYVSEINSWTQHERFRSTYQNSLNSHATEDYLLISFIYGFSLIDIDHTVLWVTSDNVTANFSCKPTMSDSMVAYLSENETGIIFRRNIPDNPFPQYRYVAFPNPDTSGAPILELDWASWHSELGAFNTQNQYLTIGLIQNPSYDKYICLTDFHLYDDPYEHSGPGFDIDSVRVLEFIDTQAYSSIFHIGSHNENFIVSTDQGNYIITPDGDISQIDIQFYITTSFSYLGDWYVKSYFTVYKSIDEGFSWVPVFNISNDPDFFVIEDKLIAAVNSTIAEVDLANSLIKYLDNNGLALSNITSVSQFQDRVYVTAIGGVFYRQLDEFFTYVDEPEWPSSRPMVEFEILD